MRKPDAEVSEEQRADAKRRIEGSLAPKTTIGGAADLIPGFGAPTASMAG
jgi:hypothetical protein